MIKLFTLLNVAGLFLFNLLFVADVSVKQDLPASMDPGSEVRVTVTVDKGTVSGFAKLQLDLPPGLSATAIETKGASFTFAEGKAKFIWMALPAQPTFTVSYTLGAAANAGGSLAVNGRFSYIEDNERKMVDLQPATVRITGNSPAMVAESKPVPATTSNTAEEVAPAMNPATEETPTTNAITGTVASTMNDGDGTPIPDAQIPATPGLVAQQGPGNVSASRTVTPVSDNEALVEVTVQKGPLRGFGKLQENIPAGFSAVATTTDDAIFSAKSGTAKFVWLNLPQKNEVKVAYRLVANGSGKGEHTVNGEFGYLVNDLTQRAVVGSSTFSLGSEAVAQEVPKVTPTVVAPVTKTEVAPKPVKPVTAEKIEPSKPVPVEKTVTAKAEPTVQKAPTTASASKVTSMTGAEKGITYKVQITAAHREVGKEYFEKRHHYSGDFSIEHNDGWIKYVTGMFDRYNSAKDLRQSYVDGNYNFPGPFVTAYNNGERITVQEAMMIAKQRSAQ